MMRLIQQMLARCQCPSIWSPMHVERAEGGHKGTCQGARMYLERCVT